MTVEYRPIPLDGFEGYEAGSDGSIWSQPQINKYPRRQLAAQFNPVTGYMHVSLKRHGVSKTKAVHVLVSLAFHGPKPPGKRDVCHNDGNKLNNVPGNLRYDTHSANKLDMRAHGTAKIGHLNHATKITVEDVLEIRQRRDQGEQFKDIAASMGRSRGTIEDAYHRRTWQHVA